MKKNTTLGLVAGLLVGVTTLFASAPAQAQYVNPADPYSWYFWANPAAAAPYAYGYPNANVYGNMYGRAGINMGYPYSTGNYYYPRRRGVINSILNSF